MTRSKFFKIVKWLLGLGIGCAVFAITLLWNSDRAARKAATGKLFDEAAEVPETPVALVFGCAKIHQGQPNLYFAYRIEAAAALWKAGKVKCFIVSGDNHAHHYNEPQDMKDSMVEAGVPADKILCDYAGLRTLDSVVRAKEIFGVEKVVLISQKFHNERAAYLAQSIGIDAVGLNAQAVGGPSAKSNTRREKLARAKMWLDVNVLKTKPKFLGKKEALPL